MDAIKTVQLSKSFGSYLCLKDCNLRVREGSVFGLLGPNGAGKTTLIRILLGYLKATSGKAMVAGYDVNDQNIKVRQQVAYLPGDARLFRTMKGRDVLRLFSGLHPYGRYKSSESVARDLDLDLDRRVMFMSTGMRQKLALAIVLGCDAPLVVLDEPTANLDPDVRASVIAAVKQIHSDGRTVILSSHIFSDIDEACDEVAILRNGEICTQQPASAFTELHVVKLKGQLPDDCLQARGNELVFSRRLRNGMQELHLKGQPQQWMSWLSDSQAEVQSISSAGVSALYSQTTNQGGETTDSQEPAERIAT